MYKDHFLNKTVLAFSKKSTELIQLKMFCFYCLPKVESRTQCLRPRPNTQSKSEAKAKDQLFKDRPFRDQGQESSRPRPRNKDTIWFQAFSKKKKKGHRVKRPTANFPRGVRRSPKRKVMEPKTKPNELKD